MKINTSRFGDLALQSADGTIQFVSASGQFSLSTPDFAFGFEKAFYAGDRGKFYFYLKECQRRKIRRSNSKIGYPNFW